jgi:4-carboxymuconolactone decarboxylase
MSGDLQSGARGWGGRLPLAEAGELSEQQRALADQLHAFAVPWAERAGFAGTTPDGHLAGPWNAQVHRPGPAAGFNQWVLADQQGSTLAPRIREVTILTVGAAWQSEYVVYSHVAASRAAGLADTVIAALCAGEPHADLSVGERAAHAFTNELVRSHFVTDKTYQAALDCFGQDGVLDLVHLISIYLATAAQLNAFKVPAPENIPRSSTS